jgi:hypothetical protein
MTEAFRSDYPRRLRNQKILFRGMVDVIVWGSQTLGRISAVRPATDDIGKEVPLIQTYSVINHGSRWNVVEVQ